MRGESRVGHHLPQDKLANLREVWLFLLGMGIAMMVLGVVAIGSSFIAGLVTGLALGLLLLLGGIFQVVTALWGRCWAGFFLHLLTGVLFLIASVFLIDLEPVVANLRNPVEATLLVAVCLLAGGIVRIIVSLAERFDGWGWALLNGVISTLLGAAIWRQWPVSGLWVLGLFVGIELFFSGVSWVALGLSVRSASTGKPLV